MKEPKTNTVKGVDGATLFTYEEGHTLRTVIECHKDMLDGADLAGAKLAGANLRNSNLTNADLTGADLARANLKHAILPNGKEAQVPPKDEAQ